MDVELPRLAFRDLTLRSNEPTTRRRTASAVDVDRMISIGGPEVVRIALADLADDDEIRPFVAARADFSFHLLHIACSVVPETDLLLTQVSLDFILSCLDVQARPAPVALSMTPERLDQPVELSHTVRLAAPLKIVDIGVERAETTTTTQVYVQAMNQLRADPKWLLIRTDSVEIKGMQRFAMIVQAPSNGGQGTLTVRATVKHRSWGAFRNAADYETQSPVTFILSG